MKKKIVTLLLISTMTFSTLAGCGNDSNTDSSQSTSQEETEKDTNTTNGNVIKENEESIVEESTETQKVEERSLSGIEQYLLDAGYLTGKRTQKAADMLGAIDGFGYDCGVEIYQYDTNSETYASVAAGKEIPLEGMDGYTVKFDAVNGEFALILSDDEASNIN